MTKLFIDQRCGPGLFCCGFSTSGVCSLSSIAWGFMGEFVKKIKEWNVGTGDENKKTTVQME
jgi:hypothetical protein